MQIYDIAKAVEETPEVPEASSESGGIDFGINSFSLANSEFAYIDQTSNIVMQLTGINMKGTGDLSADIFDLVAKGDVGDVSFAYDQTEYVSNKSLSLDMILNMDMLNSVYTFKKNEFLINEFPLHIDGDFGINKDGYDMDIAFSSPSSDFKNLYSLIPGAYTDDFSDVKSKGIVGFDGKVSGTYNDAQMPGFVFHLNVNDGQVQYPGLSEAINNINFDLAIKNASGVIEETLIDLKQMHVDFGTNPFDASLKVLNLNDYPVESAIKGKLNLADLNKMLPLDGVSAEWQLIIDAKINGKYDSINEIIPTLDIGLQLTNGFLQTPDIPSPIENINLTTEIINGTGKLSDTKIDIKNLSLSIDGQPFEATAFLENPNNLKWDATLKGDLDFEKLLGLYPIEGMDFTGKMTADLKSAGSMIDVENENYEKLATSGRIVLKDFVYIDNEMDKTFRISAASTTFSTRAITIDSFEGSAGKTNYSLSGKLLNYMRFGLKEELLEGNLTVNADLLDVNEWMVTEETTEAEENVETVETAEVYEVVRLPKNVDFVFDAKVDKVIYNDLAMNNMKGNLKVNNGILELNKTNFEVLNGTVELNGKYDSKPVKPSFGFGFNVKEVSIPAAFEGVSMIKSLAPIAQSMTGNFSTDFAISGLLNADMMPDFNALTGKGGY